MTRYLLDTNIISNITKPVPSESLLAWMAEQADEDLFIASLTIAESAAAYWRSLLEKNEINSRLGFQDPRDRRRFSPAACFRSTRRPVSYGPG